jgi:hypothetical protein
MRLLWHLFKLTVPVFVLVAVVSWRLTKWTVRTTWEGISWSWKWRQRLGG